MIAAGTGVVAACSSSYDTPATSSDAGTNDGSRGFDGTTSAGDAGNVGPDGAPVTRFCETNGGASVLVCTDFDDSMSLPTGWSTDVHLAGTLGVTSADSLSAPRALEAFVPAHASGNPYQQLAWVAPQGTGRFGIELDFKASVDLAATDSTGATAFVCPIEVSTEAMPNAQVCFGKTYFGATIETYDDDAGLPGSAHQDFMKAPPTLEVWHHLRVTVAFLPTNGGVTVELDNVMLGTTPNGRTVQPSTPTGMVRIDLGVDSNGHFGDTRIRFDNVRITSL